MENELMVPDKIADMVDAHDKAIEELKQGLELLATAKARLFRHFGEYRDNLWIGQVYDSEVSSEGRIKASQLLIKQQAWKSIFDQCKIKEVASLAQWKEFEAMLEKPETLPPVTELNIEALLKNLVSNLGNMLDDSVKEAYDMLKKHCNFKWDKYKTNEKNATFDIGKKVILTWSCEGRYCGGFKLGRYYKDDNLFTVLERAFYFMAGKGLPRYPDDLATKGQNIPDSGLLETEFFRLKCHKNGNVHLEFLNDGLLARFNQKCAEVALKGRRKAS